MSELGGIKDRLTLVTAGAYFDDCRYDYDENGNLIYEGFTLVHATSTSDTEWYIWKYIYDSNGNLIRKEGPKSGSWDGRHSLSWGSELLQTEQAFRNLELESLDLLNQILIQSKITNLYLSILTGDEINEQEIK